MGPQLWGHFRLTTGESIGIVGVDSPVVTMLKNALTTEQHQSSIKALA